LVDCVGEECREEKGFFFWPAKKEKNIKRKLKTWKIAKHETTKRTKTSVNLLPTSTVRVSVTVQCSECLLPYSEGATVTVTFLSVLPLSQAVYQFVSLFEDSPVDVSLRYFVSEKWLYNL